MSDSPFEPFFPEVDRIRYEGPNSESDLAFRHYDADREIRGVRMEELLRFAVCYWHSFCWPGSDVFGEGTFDRPWLTDGRDAMVQAEHKTDVAFEFFRSSAFRSIAFTIATSHPKRIRSANPVAG